MAETHDEEELIAQGFRRVYAELDRYDGLRAGLADVDGSPHYFHGYDYDHADTADEYLVWPASEAAVALEREQWAIFVGWNRRHEAGEAGPESHPGHGGVDARYDELTGLLAAHRRPPADARRLVGEPGFDAGDRYRADGLDQWFRWHPAG
ncbi:hypothetical protein [Streptomyces yangpuensis]|uniref:hypothetical protein n=1 Tax=Streptomyces yangpuensis TaxID=1648182 RepID=UPI0036600449